MSRDEVAELRTRVEALEAWMRSVEARLGRHEILLMNIQAEGRKSTLDILTKLDDLARVLQPTVAT